MVLNGCRVKPGSARYFSALGGGWAVKMNLAGKRDANGNVREYVLGPYKVESVAAGIVEQLNADPEATVKVDGEQVVVLGKAA